MANPRDLPPIPTPGAPAATPSAASPATKSASDAAATKVTNDTAAAAEKNRATEKENRLKEWNLRLRQISLSSYVREPAKFHYQEEGNLNVENRDGISGANSLISELRNGRWNVKGFNFDVIVNNDTISTSPKPNGKGERAYKDSAAILMDFMRRTGASGVELNIADPKGYSSAQMYKVIEIYAKAAIDAGLGLTFGPKIQQEIYGMSLDKRDKLLALQREANAAVFGREEEVFKELLTRIKPDIAINSKFTSKVAEADDPGRRLEIVDKYTEKLDRLEANVRRAKASLKGYVDVIDEACQDEKSIEKKGIWERISRFIKSKKEDMDVLKSNIEKSQGVRDQLIADINEAEKSIVDLRSKLENELTTLSPPSEIQEPVSTIEEAEPGVEETADAEEKAGVEEKAEVEAQAEVETTLEVEAKVEEAEAGAEIEAGAGQQADSVEKSDEPIATTLNVNDTPIESNDVLNAEVGLDSSSPGAGMEAPAGTAAESVAKSTSSNAAKKEEGPAPLTEEQEGKISKLRDKLKAGALDEASKAKRQDEWKQIAARNAQKAIGDLLALNKQQQNQRKL